MGMCLIRPLGLAPAVGACQGCFAEVVNRFQPRPRSPAPPSSRDARPRSQGQLQERARHRSDENLGAENAEGEAAAGNGEMSGPPR